MNDRIAHRNIDFASGLMFFVLLLATSGVFVFAQEEKSLWESARAYCFVIIFVAAFSAIIIAYNIIWLCVDNYKMQMKRINEERNAK